MVPKFRAWDEKTIKMWNVETWHIEDEYLDMIESNKNVADLTAERIWRKQSDIKLMQSTGLKDKNGVEIYEGDVVRVFEYGRYGGTYNAPVSWISYSNEGEQWAFHGFTCIGVKEIEHHSEVESLFTRGFLTRQFGSCVQLSELTKDPRNSIKVIGNIYTNPELLEDKYEK
ncbi:YopX family protein [uncultured Enterococcus sp.]|uniref:YopX family protein n=1 Tax=uncultured Enterococcus sp. TaxID=167972 RepID=UPI00204865C4|nr:YopX family protein [uncultured Enterococcus sp.]DAL87374.1 MAG TPA: YopX protein [Caudoviricetes sp.]